MHEILIEKTLNATAENVWGVLSRFADLSWYAPAEKVEQIGEGIGQIRRIYMPGMEHPIDEVLESMDEQKREFSYTIPGMPMQDYRVVVRLTENNDQCDVRWHATFASVVDGINADDMIGMMRDTYASMLNDIEAAAC